MSRPRDPTRVVLERMRAGDREAFDRFFERHSARLLVYINYRIGSKLRRKVGPDDILQNVYLRLFKSFGSFLKRSERLGIEKALIRMADHEITESYRFHFKVSKRDARRELTACWRGPDQDSQESPLDWIPADSTSISARVARHEEYRRLIELLSRLEPREQLVVVARVIAGVSASDIAERLHMSRGAVHNLIARARDKLQELARRNGRARET